MEKMKIAVIGLGLIGGSIFKALMSKGFDVVGISKSQSGEKIYKNYSMLSDRDLVFVCTKLNETLSTLKEIEEYTNNNTIVCDVASVKTFLYDKKFSYNFISTHPMAGTEFSGFDSSFCELFLDAKWVIEKNNEKLEYIIKTLGAKPILADLKSQDTACALISHMPLLLAFSLFKTAQNNELALKLASSGFRDMTRLSMTNSDLAFDMLNLNKKQVDFAINELVTSLNYIKNLNEKEQKTFFDEIAKQRQEMYKNGKNQK